MALTDPPAIWKLANDDIGQAMELSTEASWNQIEADWRLFLDHGDVFGIRMDGALVATAATIPYGDDLAWISMVLTRKTWRGRGLGTLLLKHCIEFLESERRAAFLDATPAGEPIYRSLGFEPVFSLTRWQGQGGGAGGGVHDAPFDLEQAIAGANAAFGGDRRPVLSDFATRCPGLTVASPSGAVAFARNGRVAVQIGPVIADDDRSAADLIAELIAKVQGPVFLDVNNRCAHVVERLESLGFTRQRPFLRMKRGRMKAPMDDIRTIAIAGPEFG